jgi:TolB-like protein/Flp pilus assembly protein TadD
MNSFFRELKQRKVYRVALGYAVVAWLVVQISATVMPAYHAPDWILPIFITVVALGFPVALVLAWAFELKGGVIEKTPESTGRLAAVNKRRVWLLAAAGLIISALTVGGYWIWHPWLNTSAAKSITASTASEPSTVTTPAVSEKSIAVLPFANLSRDPDNAYFATGIQDEIITRLAKITELKVISCTSTHRFKSAPDDLPAIAKELRVANIMEGSVQRYADQVRVNVQLIKAESDAHLWADTFDRKLTDIFAVESEIARTIAETLQAKLTGDEQRQLNRRDTSNPEAYEFYLKGRYYWEKRTGQNLRKAIDQFQQAADKDSDYALAYAGLADCYLLLEDYLGAPASETYPKAKAFAERALQLDNSLAEAHTSLAYAYTNLWQWEQAEEEFKRAVKLSPNYPTAHHWYSLLLLDLGRIDEAMAEIKSAHELDPLSLIIGTTLTYAYLAEGDANSSVAQCKRVIDFDPNFSRAHEYLGLAYLKQERHSEAIGELQKAVELSRERRQLRDLGYGYAISGKRTEALNLLKELEGKYEKHQAIGQDLAAVYAGLGEKDQAFAWLEKDFQARSGPLAWIRWIAPFDLLRSDARHADLLRRMGIPR